MNAMHTALAKWGDQPIAGTRRSCWSPVTRFTGVILTSRRSQQVSNVVIKRRYTHHSRRSQPRAVKHRHEGIKGRGEGEDREGEEEAEI